MLVFHFIFSTSHYARLLVYPDRAPVAYLVSTRERLPLEKLGNAVQTFPPPGPLGPRPIILNARIIECWLPEDEWRHWKGACHVPSYVPKAILRIEEEILKYEAEPDFPNLLLEFQPFPPKGPFGSSRPAH